MDAENLKWYLALIAIVVVSMAAYFYVVQPGIAKALALAKTKTSS